MEFYYGEEQQQAQEPVAVATTAVELVREMGLVQGDWREAAAAAWAAEAATEAEVEETGALTGWDATNGASDAQTTTNGLDLIAQYSDSE